MSGRRESAPVRGAFFGLLTLLFGWACLSLHQAGNINWSLRVNKVPTLFQLSRATDGWQFELLVATCGLLALASVFAVRLAVSDLISPEKTTP